ncbi:MAG TPA: HlyD family type I secretion periplasmic adaptor subunit [Candidatus Sulfotelmatobacter sp.]|nr:HlyD family type I secretion periplasmic adaptor subunit [Candidatus Sulfotelmatobacter sp.]
MQQLVPTWQVALETDDRGPSLRRIVISSLIIIAVGFGSFFTWALTAPLDSAVPAAGTIVVESKRKTVSLLDAGILKQLYVKEGSRVEAGQTLLRLDDTQALAQLGSLKVQRWTMVARIARLRAEQGGQSTISFPQELLDAAAKDQGVAALVTNERHVFDDRRTAYNGTLAVQQKKASQLQDEINALKAQETSARQRLAYTEQELAGVNELLAKGYATKTKLFELERNKAELTGNLGEITAKESEGRQAIAQNDLEMTSTRDQRQQDISKDLQDAQAADADLVEKIRGAADIQAKTNVTAPEAGTVTDIKFFTPGSSIGAGLPILDIVPQSDKMLVEAEVRPEDIEHVHTGQRVNVRLTAYKQHKVPVLTGRLTYVSADRQEDAKGDEFFLARAEIDPDALARLKGVALAPGMPAEVLIIGGERTAIDYFISPITDSLHRSLHEQ